MPLPKPRAGEARAEFMRRCIVNPQVQSDFDNVDQRVAVCASLYEGESKAITPAKRAFQLRQDRLMQSVERGFRAAIAREKNRFIRDNVKIIVSERTVNDILREEHRAAMQEIFIRYYGRIIKLFSLETERQVQSAAWLDLEQKQDFWEFLLAAFINRYGAKKVKQTSDTTVQDVEDALQTALASDGTQTEDSLIRGVLRTRGFSIWRADTIARTEMHGAAMYASDNTAQKISMDTGLQLLKEWVPALDERTRTSHAVMSESKPVPLDQPFKVGGEPLMYPGDPAGSASNVINCRCVIVHIAE